MRQVTYRTSGVKQGAAGNAYMQLQGSDGSFKLLAVELPPLATMQNVVLDTNSRMAHVWNYDAVLNSYTASKCGVFGCCCCDESNLQARKDALMQERG